MKYQIKTTWRKIPDYSDYYVSDDGQVASRKHGGWHILSPRDDGRSYQMVDLYKNGKRKTYKVHRLVAEVFIPNPNDLPQVDHINRNPADNRVSNLRWATSATNNENRVGKTAQRPVAQYTKSGKLIAKYPSTIEASRKTGVHNGNLVSCLKGKRNFAGGYIWKYLQEGAE